MVGDGGVMVEKMVGDGGVMVEKRLVARNGWLSPDTLRDFMSRIRSGRLSPVLGPEL